MPRRLADLYEHGRFIRSAGAGAVGMTDEQGPDHRDFIVVTPGIGSYQRGRYGRRGAGGHLFPLVA
jgi:hypothetical protein